MHVLLLLLLQLLLLLLEFLLARLGLLLRSRLH